MSFVDMTIYIMAREPLSFARDVERRAEIRFQGDSRIVLPIIALLQRGGFLTTTVPDAPERAREGTKKETNGN